MESAGDRVPAPTELAAGMQHGEDDLDRRLALGAVHVHGDSTTVVHHADGAVLEDRDLDRVAMTGQGLIDGVVDDLVHQVVESALPRRTDVHAGALAHRLQAFEHLNGVGPVLGGCPRGDGCGVVGRVLGNAVGVLGRHG